jgi:DNA-binding NtrC family response regulator
MSETTYTPDRERHDTSVPTVWALTIMQCTAEPHRIGESAVLPPGESTLGRHGDLPWARHRPSKVRPAARLADRQLSRVQLRIRREGRKVTVVNEGRQPLKLNRRDVTEATLQDGDVLQIGTRVVLRFQRRVALTGEAPSHAFGMPDALGIVGETPAAWALRARLAFVGPRSAHALIVGPSGTGKELAARALHLLHAGPAAPWVARSAATIPTTLADAELFGNCKNYPNSGAMARPGLVGEAHGGTLFLDEIGKLPSEVQVRLLRVLDEGEYSRLGEAKHRRSTLRFVAATNRDPAILEDDVRARLKLMVELPGLGDRREDIPLIAAHLMRRIVAQEPDLAVRFMEGDYPRFSASLVVHFALRPWTTHVRELDALLWRSMSESLGDQLDLPGSIAHAPQSTHVDPSSVTPEAIQASLDRHDGKQELVWRELGLSSRHVLARLIRKHKLRKS